MFYAVRDVPYRINTESRDASCRSKTKILGDLLTRINLRVKVAFGKFYWKDIGVPEQLLKLAPEPYVNHFFLRIYIPETKKWVSVDPTWDPELRGAFPIAEWDGLTSTTLAAPVKRIQIIKRGKKEITPYDYPFTNFDPTDAFTKALNRWYASQRKGGV